ncbi:transmembrane protein, putative [Medicago truncatula]|uniref:Transmembrane protein, putative n=1 Tax=Medicago truncatula TaxID=3880 RepID=A0A072UEW8_MEDTR|nr:transmembrane protein, putative [Medicago truncatula]
MAWLHGSLKDLENALTAKMPQWARDLAGSLFILLFLIFGHRELKVGREYMVIMFNGFINA